MKTILRLNKDGLGTKQPIYLNPQNNARYCMLETYGGLENGKYNALCLVTPDGTKTSLFECGSVEDAIEWAENFFKDNGFRIIDPEEYAKE